MVDFRRWMMASQSPVSASNSRRSNTPAWKDTEVNRPDEISSYGVDTIKDPNSIEGVVQRLMDPHVSEEETADYQRFVILIILSFNSTEGGCIDMWTNTKHCWQHPLA